MGRRSTPAVRDDWDDWTAVAYLESQGYTQVHGFRWQKPSPAHVVTDMEDEALCYLINEWDWGGLIEEGW